MDNEYVFRKAKEEDISSICIIEKESFDKPWSYEMFAEEISDNDKARYFVVEYKSDIIGYAGYWNILVEAHITNMAVKPAHRKKGVGSLILKKLFFEFKKEGIKRSTLEVDDNNEKALHIYKKAGYEIKGIRKNYYGEGRDAYIMWKEDEGDNDQY